MDEFKQKQAIIKDFLKKHNLDALLLQRVSSVAWATCGAPSYINTAATTGAMSLLITPRYRYLITNTIEAPRYEKEEGLAAQGWKFKVAPWYQGQDFISDLSKGLRLGADGPFPGAVDLSADMARLRTLLLPVEQDRFRDLGKLCAEAMETAIRAVRPGMSEYEIASLLGGEAQKRGAQPIVNLIATDERIFSYRHPLPTAKKLDKYAMLVLCGRQKGLVCSVTRLVYFGKLPEEIRRKMEATALVDAAFIVGTRPGRTLGEIFAEAQAVYAKTGFGEEWKLHHQGGPAAYEPREYTATPDSKDEVSTGQVYAWNPSITGTKSEDTILITEKGYEVLTEMGDWPMLKVSFDRHSLKRPAILEMI